MKNRVTRRNFLARSAAASIAFPAIIRASALGKNGTVAPSNRIVMGGIGLRGRGTTDLKWMLQNPEVQFVSICDVKKESREAIKALADEHHGNKDCTMYRDLREFLASRPDIDAVLIATGDRWHALASILAMKAGKDVYCEKPGSMTIAEGRAVADTAKRYSRVFQTGAQRMSEAKFVFATELACAGMLGKVHTVRAHLLTRVKDVTYNEILPAQPELPEEEFDWNLWLGPVPWRSYNSSYIKNCSAWIIYSDLAAGVAGWGSHTIAQCQAAVGKEYTSPIHYSYPGNSSGDGLVARFDNGVKLVMNFEGWRGTCGVKFEGSEGWTSIADGYSKPDTSSPAMLKEFECLIHKYAAKYQRPFDHVQDFLDCVRTRRTTVANAEVMHRSMTTNHAINICLALKRDLEWDPEEEEFEGDDEANRLRSRAMRYPWHI